MGRLTDRGAAAVEFALVLPVLLMIIFGVIDFGRMLNAQLTVNEAAREGARAMALYGQDAGEDRVRRVGEQIGDVVPDARSVCPDSPGPDDDAIMRATYEFHYVTPLGALVNAIADKETLTAESVMPCYR